jgi:hypothetical protein
MSIPGSSQVHLIQTVQHSFVRLNVGGAGPAVVKKVLDEFQEFVKSRFPEGGISLDQGGDNVVGREHLAVGHGGEQRILPAYVSFSLQLCV